MDNVNQHIIAEKILEKAKRCRFLDNRRLR